MADAKTFNINGTSYTIIDQTARDNAAKAITEEAYDWQDSMGLYAGRSIASVFASEIGSADIWTWLGQRIQANNFSGLRIGDYIDIPISGWPTLRARIGSADIYYGCMDQQVTRHHLAMIFDPIPIYDEEWQTTDGQYLYWGETASNQGDADEKHPYLSSLLHEWETTVLLPKLPQTMQARMLSRRCLLEERYSASGATDESTSWSWVDLGKVWSLSEMEVYGAPVWGTKGYSVGESSQWLIFKQAKNRVPVRCNWWLRSLVGGSSVYVCDVTNAADCNGGSPRYAWVRPRPGFLLG